MDSDTTNLIATITVAFLAMLVPLITVLVKAVRDTKKSNDRAEETLRRLCQKLEAKDNAQR